MIRSRAIYAALSIALAIAACTTEETPQQRHFGLYHSVRGIEGAIATGLNNPRLTELLQVANAELLISRDRVLNPDEQTMAKMYADALEAYADSLKLWNAQIAWASVDSLKGRIPIEDGLEPVAQAYGLRIVDFKVPYSGQTMKTVMEEGAIQAVWAEAGKRSTAAAKAYLELGRRK